MPVFLGFLRAVNVGKRQYPMAELRAALIEAGFEDVATHIQTGNVSVRTSMRSRARVAAELERVFAADRGFEVPTIVRTPAEVLALAGEVDELSAEHRPAHGHYVCLCAEAPSAEQARKLQSLSTEGETVIVRGDNVHLLYDVPYHQATNSGAAVEKVAGIATARNATVIRAIRDKWCS